MLLHPLWQCWEWKQFWWICVLNSDLRVRKHSVCLCWFRPVVSLENQVCRCKLQSADQMSISSDSQVVELQYVRPTSAFISHMQGNSCCLYVHVYVYSVWQILVLVLYQLAFGIKLFSISPASCFQITASLFKLLQLHFALICLCVITFVTWRLLLVCSSFLILSLRIMLYVV